MNRDLIAEENAWWDRYMDDRDAAEREAMRDAESSADLYEFDTEEEREAYILEVYESRLAELTA